MPAQPAVVVLHDGRLTGLLAENVLRWVEGRPLHDVVDDKALGYVPSPGSVP